MNVNYTLAIQLFLEIIMLPFFAIPFVLVVLIINGISIVNKICILFSKSKEEIILEDNTTKDNFAINEILQITDTAKQVDKFFKHFDFDINFLHKLLENFTEEQKKKFLDKLIESCREKLSDENNDNETKQNAMITLSLAIKYKNIKNYSSKVTKK